jgi:ArsR family transcriptional regulator, lead/cadmium/zinc/bismuth-responsive transcriptional repressor
MAITELKAYELADLFSTLGDASRVRIISALLEGEMSVGTLAGQLHMSDSAVSHQLRGLRQMRLIRGRRDGRQVFYRLADGHVEQLFRMGLEHVRNG